ncbi:MAG: tRNA uridine(34) 5-carboxymethylaminomethyl modification radical SAM/GNAT enzyme Elp3 [Patescibacteria group bacterium]
MANIDKLKSLVQSLARRKIKDSEQFLEYKRSLLAKLNIAPPGNVEILNIYRGLRQQKTIKANFYFEKRLKKHPVRSLSGIASVAVLTKPWPCPGKCIYCPEEKNIPKSYLSGEPAVDRAKSLKFNPYLQVAKRIEVLEKNGHPTDKIELIVIGGTWSCLPKRYQTWFIKRCFDGANGKTSKNLAVAQKINEKAKHRIVGLTLETRPDFITEEEIRRMRQLGCTRVEIGVQSIDDKISKFNQRGITAEQIAETTELLKNAGFKICYHLMPGLPKSSPQKDYQVFKKIFTDEKFQPDMLKIYPCVVVKGSKLYKMWRKKKFIPYSDKALINLLVKIKKEIIPPYVRIMRLFRDIPSNLIEGGTKISNLREIILKQLKKQNISCQCIHCREIKDEPLKLFKNIKLIKRIYRASGGQEIFLSFEDIQKNKLIAFLRLRLPAKKTKNHI